MEEKADLAKLSAPLILSYRARPPRHVSRDFLLSAVLVAAAVDTIGIPIFGHLSDRIGRKRMYLLGAIATGAYALLYFSLLNSGVPSMIFLGIALSLVPHSMMYGPQGALIAECFTPSLRYSGASLGYQFASIVAGGPAPLIATALLAAYGSGYPIAGYIFFCALVSIVATWFLPGYTNRDISEEHSKKASINLLSESFPHSWLSVRAATR